METIIEEIIGTHASVPSSAVCIGVPVYLVSQSHISYNMCVYHNIIGYTSSYHNISNSYIYIGFDRFLQFLITEQVMVRAHNTTRTWYTRYTWYTKYTRYTWYTSRLFNCSIRRSKVKPIKKYFFSYILCVTMIESKAEFSEFSESALHFI